MSHTNFFISSVYFLLFGGSLLQVPWTNKGILSSFTGWLGRCCVCFRWCSQLTLLRVSGFKVYYVCLFWLNFLNARGLSCRCRSFSSSAPSSLSFVIFAECLWKFPSQTFMFFSLLPVLFGSENVCVVYADFPRRIECNFKLLLLCCCWSLSYLRLLSKKWIPVQMLLEVYLLPHWSTTLPLPCSKTKIHHPELETLNLRGKVSL